MSATDLQHTETVIRGSTDPATAHAIQEAILDFLEAGGVEMGDDGWPVGDVSLSELTLDQDGHLEVVLRQHRNCGYSIYPEDDQ